MKVLLVTTWANACGIAEHSWYLKQHVEAADPTIEVVPCPEGLDPYTLLYPYALLYAVDRTKEPYPIVHLNYQASLHSRWGPEQIEQVRALVGKVVVTYHDTGVPNSEQCKAVIDAANVAIVHEPFDDLPADKVRYWRMGVPDWVAPTVFDQSPGGWCGRRPILGSIGFPFPWKHYDQLARVTGEIGWALYLIAPHATSEQYEAWKTLNPHLYVRADFVPRIEAISILAGCDATAFTYVTHNTGQSGAILQGIAARKPVVALSTCRQFRALFNDKLGRTAISWCETFEDVKRVLCTTTIQRCDPAIVAFAEQESWAKLGARYAQLYQELAR